MLITKFNKLIRNRIIWTAFAILVSLSFLGWFTQSGGCIPEKNDIAGKVNGTDVSLHELAMARQIEALISMDDEPSPSELDDRAWQRVASLRAAEEIGIDVPRQELARIISRDPAFAENGAFSPAKYRFVIETRFGGNAMLFTEYVRQSVVFQKLISCLEAMTWTTPGETEQKLANLTDMFTLEYIVISTNNIPAIEADENDIADFYARHGDIFKTPEKLRVKFIDFPLSEYDGEVIVSQQSIADYYDYNESEFAVTGTNGLEMIRPLDEVSSTISNKLYFEKAVSMAKDAAMEFILSMEPDRYGKALTLEKALAKFNRSVNTSEYFSSYSIVTNPPDAGMDFNRAAFALDWESERIVLSDPVAGESSVYVLTADSRIPSFVPELEAIKPQVAGIATQNLRREKLITYSGEILEKLATDAPLPFSMKAAGLGFNVTTTKQFSVYSEEPVDFKYYDEIAPEIANLGAGELTSRPVAVKDGFIIASVASRQPGDSLSKELLKPQFLSATARYRGKALFSDWTRTSSLNVEKATSSPEPIDDAGTEPETGL